MKASGLIKKWLETGLETAVKLCTIMLEVKSDPNHNSFSGSVSHMCTYILFKTNTANVYCR